MSLKSTPKVIIFRLKIEVKRHRKNKQNKTYFLDRFWLHFGDHFGPKNIKKGLKNRSLARGVSEGAPGLIFDRFLIDLGRFSDVFGSCFCRILKKLRDVHFIVSIFIVFVFLVVGVCVCVVSCRVWGPEHVYLLAFLESSLGGPQEHAYLLATPGTYVFTGVPGVRNMRID